jgi:hypothetical protein
MNLEDQKRAAALMAANTLVLSNCEMGDESFETDGLTYNVTRGYQLGEGPFLFSVAELIVGSQNYEWDRAHAARLTTARLLDPLLLLERADSSVILIDGVHRLNRLHQLGRDYVAGFLVRKWMVPQIEIWFSLLSPGGNVVVQARSFEDLQKLRGATAK